jgi:glycosyltransferase involved in cell wall biosynthesis
MLVGKKFSDDIEVTECSRPSGFAPTWGGIVQKQYINPRRSSDWNTHFSLAWPGQDLSGHPLVMGADIIHLHWVWDFQSAATLARLMNLGKPVVWSFHDQRAMTGGCHFSAGCRGYEDDCRDCPQLSTDPAGITSAAHADQLRFWWRDAVTVVGPSRWMAECAQRSSIWRGSRIEVIPYSVETDRYRPQDKLKCRRRLGLPEHARYVLFGADHGQEIRKGFRGLMRALELCHHDPWFSKHLRDGRIAFICFGNPGHDAASCPVPIRSLGYLRDDADLAAAYGSADLFMLPSLEDNLPNTVLESMSCGTPVMALDVGGARDMVLEGHTGWLIPPADDRQLADALLRVLKNPGIAAGMADACRDRVANSFSPALQASRFGALYSDLLRHPPAVESAIGIADPEVPVQVDMGSKSRLAMIEVFKLIVTEQSAKPQQSKSKQGQQLRFRQQLKLELNRVGTYAELLAGLERSFLESRKKPSRLGRIRQALMSQIKKTFGEGAEGIAGPRCSATDGLN